MRKLSRPCAGCNATFSPLPLFDSAAILNLPLPRGYAVRWLRRRYPGFSEHYARLIVERSGLGDAR